MTSTSSIILTLLPLILIIFLLVFFIRRHTRKEHKEKINYFKEACRGKNFHIEFFMERRGRMAALSLQSKQIALADFTNDTRPEVLFLPIGAPANTQILKITKARNIVQKITIQPPYKAHLKKTPGIVFYDVEDDDMMKLEAYMAEAREWEKTLLQYRDDQHI